MASYVVMEPPGQSGRAGESTIFVRDGFSLLAFFIPVVWLLWHRLWIEAAIALALSLGIAVLGTQGEFVGAPLVSVLVSTLFGLEGPALRLAALRRRGWREVGLVEADSYEDAETRYLVSEPEDAPEDQSWPSMQHGPQPARGRGEPVRGSGLLFDPGRS